MRDFQVVRGLLGSESVTYSCPQCKAALKSRLANAGQSEFCPECGKPFVVPGLEAKKESLRLKDEQTAAKNAKAEAKREAKKIEQLAISHQQQLLAERSKQRELAQIANRNIQINEEEARSTLVPCEHCGHMIWEGAELCPNCNGVQPVLAPEGGCGEGCLKGCLILLVSWALLFLGCQVL